MRYIDKIIWHCSGTPSPFNGGVDVIRSWHLKRGFSDVGYHFVVKRNGLVEVGRPMHLTGAHLKGHNLDSIGICWIGGVDGVDNRTSRQVIAMHQLQAILWRMFPNATVHGHNEFADKYCPSFDVDEFRIKIK